MSVRLPASDKDRLRVLDSIHLLSSQASTSPPDPPEGDAPESDATIIPSVALPQSLSLQLQQCRAHFGAVVRQSMQLQQDLETQRHIRDDHVSKVREGLRNYWSALNYYASSHPNAKKPHAFYGMSSGAVARMSIIQVLSLAKQVLEAVGQANEQGYPVITLGSSQGAFERSVAALEEAMTFIAVVAESQPERKLVRVKARKACDQVLSDTVAFFRYSYRGYDYEDVRNKLRSYGFKFQFDNAQAPAAEDASDASSPDVADANPSQEGSDSVAEISPEALSSIG